MRCKPDDLAVVVGGLPEFLGVIVKVLRPWDLPIYLDVGPGWYVDHNGLVCHCADKHLSPIRPQSDDAVDEMTLLAGKPEGVTA